MNVTFIVGSVMNYLTAAFTVVIAVGLAVRFYRNRLSKQIAVKARVIDKYAVAHVQYGKGAPQNITDYTAAFDCGGRTKKFFVSCLVYDGLQKGENGILTYRSSHFIGFERKN